MYLFNAYWCRWVPLVEQELLTLLEHLSSARFFVCGGVKRTHRNSFLCSFFNTLPPIWHQWSALCYILWQKRLLQFCHFIQTLIYPRNLYFRTHMLHSSLLVLFPDFSQSHRLLYTELLSQECLENRPILYFKKCFGRYHCLV